MDVIKALKGAVGLAALEDLSQEQQADYLRVEIGKLRRRIKRAQASASIKKELFFCESLARKTGNDKIAGLISGLQQTTDENNPRKGVTQATSKTDMGIVLRRIDKMLKEKKRG